MSKKKTGKPVIALLIIAFVFAAICGLHLPGVFHFLENKSYDFRVRFWAGSIYSRPSDYITVIVLDQDSLDWAQKERGWGWPWPRQAYAEVIDYMNLAGAKSVAFDVIYSEPSIYRNAKQDEIIDNAVLRLEEIEDTGDGIDDTRQPRGGRQNVRAVIAALQNLSARVDDAGFAAAAKNYGHAVQAVVFSRQTGSSLSWPPGIDVPLFQPQGFGPMLEKYSLGNNERGQFPIQELRETAGALGSVTGIPDSDGIYRRLQPFTIFDGRALPGLSAASLIVSGMEQIITYDEKNGSIKWGNIIIPVDKNGFALLRYRGPIDRYIPYKASAILQSLESIKTDGQPVLDPSIFTDTHVFFGFYAQGLFDIFATPVSSLYPGMGCHITMLDNMLQGDFIRESGELLNLLILLAVITAVVCLTMFSHQIPVSLGGTSAVVAAIVAGAFLSYQFGGLWVPMITYLAGTLAAFVTVTLYNYATEGSQKRFIKSAFSQYLSPKVIEQIIHDPSQLKLGGEKRDMTALFTDVRAFSTISEALGDPAKLVELLNFYLTRMSDIVLNNQGTIDKYMGDAIIGFFGAPIHFDNHASLACRSAVLMKKAEIEVNREAIKAGLITGKVIDALAAKGKLGYINPGNICLGNTGGEPCPLYTRIGLNTGDMVVGNMGTPNKMDYTIMGNAVNLASRLEGVNDQYNTFGIIISEYTRSFTGDEFILRPLSRVRVVGINTPLRLFELLDIADEASPELTAMVKNWEQAFDFYEKKDFIAAKNIFQVIYQKNNADLTAKKYMERCEKYQISAPNEKEWDNGVDNLTSK